MSERAARPAAKPTAADVDRLEATAFGLLLAFLEGRACVEITKSPPKFEDSTSGVITVRLKRD